MNAGFFLVYRKVWENQLLRDETFTEREAWLWMIGAANYEPKKLQLGKSQICIKRGQFITSQRKLAQRFKWTRGKLRLFLEKLKIGDEKGARIKARYEAHSATLVTICNYDKYQLLKPMNGPNLQPTSDPQLINNINEIIKLKDVFNRLCPSLPKVPNITERNKARIATVKARLKEYPDIMFWENLFEEVERSDFLTGRISSKNGQGTWRATFDWIMKPSNYAKIAEGNYRNINPDVAAIGSSRGEGYDRSQYDGLEQNI